MGSKERCGDIDQQGTFSGGVLIVHLILVEEKVQIVDLGFGLAFAAGVDGDDVGDPAGETCTAISSVVGTGTEA